MRFWSRSSRSYQRTEEFTQPIEKEVLTLQRLRRVRGDVGTGNASFGINMVPLDERTLV